MRRGTSVDLTQDDDLKWMDGMTLQDLIRRGEASALELARADSTGYLLGLAIAEDVHPPDGTRH